MYSRGTVESRKAILLELLDLNPELAEPLIKFAESINTIRAARGTLDDMEGGLLDSQRALMGELLPALVSERAGAAVDDALAMAGTKRYRKKRS